MTSVQDDGGTMLQGKIKPGDVIRTFNGETVLDPRDLARKAAVTPVGSKAVLGTIPGGASSPVHVTVHAWPEEKPGVLNNDAAPDAWSGTGSAAKTTKANRS